MPKPLAHQAPYRAKKPEEVDAEAWAHVFSEGGDTANITLVLSRWKVQFGRYQGKTFHWLLENDVGYAVNLVASHQKERERTGSQSPLMANKDAFTRYSSAYPDFVEAVRFHRAFEEAREKSLQPGQEGQALVGFGDFKFETLQSLYESEDPKKIRFVNYLRRKAPAPGTQMENAVRYVRSRDRQRAAASTTTTTASVLAASQGARSASQCVFYVKAVEEPGGPFSVCRVVKGLRPSSPGGILCLRWRCGQRSRSWCLRLRLQTSFSLNTIRGAFR
ncbi:uncharacterized protein LOC122862328 [Siniperca chuatsi]|uniref:uncharacterized protein LOC122862328 n=1 Tax=Siniperca chuatsi TaxID=119488 RepID=UPI001CE02E08|nr:uncharacterized protein LOC122862328 [Siniperca chuatsi]